VEAPALLFARPRESGFTRADRAERYQERFQETFARSHAREKNEKTTDEGQEPSAELIALFESIGFNGDAKGRAIRALSRVPGSSGRFMRWLREARRQGLERDDAIAMAERRTMRGDGEEELNAAQRSAPTKAVA
jgi:hypothetical protein